MKRKICDVPLGAPYSRVLWVKCQTEHIESQNNLGLGMPLRTWSQGVNLVLSSPPVNSVPKCDVNKLC